MRAMTTPRLLSIFVAAACWRSVRARLAPKIKALMMVQKFRKSTPAAGFSLPDRI